ncbi:MAG: hypothetical protein AAFO57_00460 [Pseudomonadota bacterium]
MGTTRKPRKAYRPLAQKQATRALESARASQMQDGDADLFRLAVLSALDAISKGLGAASDWNTIASAMNHALELTRTGVGEEIMPVLLAANDGMMRTRERFERTGRLGFDGDAIRDIREALDLWFDQLMLCTVGQVDAATRQVRKRTEMAAA